MDDKRSMETRTHDRLLLYIELQKAAQAIMSYLWVSEDINGFDREDTKSFLDYLEKLDKFFGIDIKRHEHIFTQAVIKEGTTNDGRTSTENTGKPVTDNSGK